MKRFLAAPLLLLHISALGASQVHVPLHRFALIAGTNDGGAGRVHLRYATSDAQAFSRVMEELGGLMPKDRLLLLDGTIADVRDGLKRLSESIRVARASGQRVELIVYYSGHSDEDGLLLKGERLSYLELRELLEKAPANVRIAILDSCASGALTRGKGGTLRPAFMTDESSKMSGHAFLTSSSADEASQESDRIGASYFTNYLISGLRGAADTTHNRKVTLNEAYHFAFQETLARTEKTQHGAQHPAFDMQLSGTGDLVMTDLRETTATLWVPEGISGRLFVRDSEGRLVAELNKIPGRGVELGLEAGAYQVTLDVQGRVSEMNVLVKAGEATMVPVDGFVSQPLDATAARGDEPNPEVPQPAPSARYQEVPFNFQLVPGVLFRSGKVSNHFSIGLIAGHSDRLAGFALSSLVDTVADDAVGAQLAGVVAVTGGNFHGTQLAGTVDIVNGTLSGGQFAGAVSVAHQVNGWQASGAFNHSTLDARLQLAGGANSAGSVHGAQVAGGLNWAGDVVGAQISVVNIGGDVVGQQIGVLNIANSIRGAQVGVVNIAGRMEGAPIGLLNFFGNGEGHFQAWASELFLTNAQVSLGTHNLYTFFAAGTDPASSPLRWSYGLGFGGHLDAGAAFFDLDGSAHTVHLGNDFNGNNLQAVLRLTVGWQLARHFALVGGLTGNVFIPFDGGASNTPDRIYASLPRILASDVRAGRGEIHLWPGAFVGIRI